MCVCVYVCMCVCVCAYVSCESSDGYVCGGYVCGGYVCGRYVCGGYVCVRVFQARAGQMMRSCYTNFNSDGDIFSDCNIQLVEFRHLVTMVVVVMDHEP